MLARVVGLLPHKLEMTLLIAFGGVLASNLFV
jgi:hypothetical protein